MRKILEFNYSKKSDLHLESQLSDDESETENKEINKKDEKELN